MNTYHHKILKLDAQGQPQAWISRYSAAIYYAKNLIAAEYGKTLYTLYGGWNNDGVQSTLEINSVIQISSECGTGFTKKRLKPKLSKAAVFNRDAKICAYCGKLYTLRDLTWDHIIPVSKSGPTIWENLITSCRRCNHFKANKSVDDVGYKPYYTAFKPTLSEFLYITNNRMLFEQEEFLIGYISEKSRIFTSRTIYKNLLEV